MINTIHYFIDCETSGFCPKKNALLEVCIIKHVDRVEVDRLYLKIHPSNQDVIEPAALTCNGLKPILFVTTQVLTLDSLKDLGKNME